MSRDRAGPEDAFVTNYASPIVLEVSILVLIESAAIWRFCWALQRFHFWCLQSIRTQRGFSSRKAAPRCPVLLRVEVKML
jgi:hypothetical protein